MTESIQTTTFLKNYKSPDFIVDKLHLTFELDEAITRVTSQIQLHAINGETTLTLNGEELTLESIKRDNQILEANHFSINNDQLIITEMPERCILEIVTIIKPQENTALSGLYKSGVNFCTQCEAEGFRRITYFFDRPDVMTRYLTTIIADKAKYPILLSNGNLVASGEMDAGKHWVKWEDPFKKPCYLFALVAGDLEVVEDVFETISKRQVALKIYVEKGNQDKCAHAMAAVKKAMRWDEEVYGREYDLDIYMIVAVSDFNMGAMENKGLNIFNTKYILARPETATDIDFVHVESVIAHEYFHNWTGNRITCRDWFQLSLKEGLTIFRDQSFTADTTSKAVARINDVTALRLSQFPEDAGPLAHPVRPESYIEINNFYTATIYNKGSEVIRMMKTIIGDANYRKGMDLYFERFDGQAVTIDDFVQAMQDASEVNLSQFRLWYSQAGTPVITVHDHYDPNQQVYKLTIKQTLADSPGQKNKKPMHIPIKMGLLDNSGKEILHDILHLKNSSETFEFKNIKSAPIPSLFRDFSAPIKLNYGYSDHSLQILFQHDGNSFNRWEAGQKYSLNLMLNQIRNIQKDEPVSVPDELTRAFSKVLESTQDDKLLLAEMLSLPSERYIAEQMSTIDVNSIHIVRENFLFVIAQLLKDTFYELYKVNHNTLSFQFNMQEMGRRSLKNLCLFYLTQLPDHESVAMHQLETSLTSNMTDAIAALKCLANIHGKIREESLDKFYQTWRGDALVVDKWLSIQATSKLPGTLYRVKQLMEHEAFDIKNPNKVYSLIGAFCNNNLANFHLQSGEGYQFLRETVMHLDSLNPQIAARMLQPLTNWKRYDEGRQKIMREQLQIIAHEKKISPDVYELTIKSLKETL